MILSLHKNKLMRTTQNKRNEKQARSTENATSTPKTKLSTT